MSVVHDTEHVVPLLDDAVVDELDELVDVVPLDELEVLVVQPMHCSGGLSPGAVPPGGATQS
jgi:hypothetical protein